MQTFQVLTQGVGHDKDFALGYRYVDAAVAAWYAPFAHNRLGVSKSDQPDAIYVVQSYFCNHIEFDIFGKVC